MPRTFATVRLLGVSNRMIGTKLSHYRILSKIGEGGMGEVYLAEDTTLDRQVALKVLPAELAADPDRLARFEREAKAIAALNHPNIVTIHHVEEAEGRKILVMELVEGESLDKKLSPGGLSLSKVFDVAIPMADALAAAHEKGIIHRDLKPANVMITHEGRVKVLDFGLAKLATESVMPFADGEATQTAMLTREGTVMGTAPYMSPEQLQGKSIDPRSDIFALGILLYEMVTGDRPFQGESGVDLASSILRETPSAVYELRPDLPRHLGRIIQHCLEKNPRDRYQSALDVRNELRALQKEVETGTISGISGAVTTQPASGPVSAVTSGPASAIGSGAVPISGSRKGLWIGLAAAALLLVGGGAWWLGRGGRVATEEGETRASQQTTVAQDSGPSVAVLPFVDLSPEKDQGYFTDGMTEELLAALGKVEGLRVPSRTAVFALKDKNLDIEQVGEHLGVSTVLEGSVRKAGDRLRISAQLVQVSDGFQLWTETYDKTLEDVFAVQDEIATAIADALQVTLKTGTAQATELGGTENSEAYDFYLRGQEYAEQTGRSNLEYALQMFEKAIEIDPEYALAHATKAQLLGNLYRNAGADPVNLEAMDRASAQALEIEPDLDRAHRVRGFYYHLADQFDAATREYQRAIEIEPDSPGNYYSFGSFLYERGELERAAEYWEKSVALDPDDRGTISMLPQLYRSLGREDDLMAATRRSLEANQRHLSLNPDDNDARLSVAIDQMQIGERENAYATVQSILDRDDLGAGDLYNVTCFYSLAGDVDAAIDAFERSIEAGYHQPDWARQDSDLDNIRDDPRFEALVQRMEKAS